MKSPNVVALLDQLARLRKLKCWTVDDVRVQINQHLSASIPDNMNGKKQVDRWLHTARKGWVEPRGEVILAVQEVLKRFNSR